MSEIKSFRDLMIWQRSKDLAVQTYHLSKEFPSTEQYALTQQMRRSAVSVPSNIAEGYGRGQNKPFSNALKIARGSLYELSTQVEIAQELDFFLNKNDSEIIQNEIEEITKMINSLIYKIDNRL